MIPASYGTFFSASTSASAALLGLLFVAVTLSPETTIGAQATTLRKGQATSAFVALLNVFFISIIALLPHADVAEVALIFGVIALATTVNLGKLRVRAIRSDSVEAWQILLSLAAVVTYGLEIIFALLLINNRHDSGALNGLIDLLMAFYGIGIGRAWNLMGDPEFEGLGRLRKMGERLFRSGDGEQGSSAKSEASEEV